MKVELYGKPYDQNCQNAISLLKSANIKIKFYNTDRDYSKKRLVGLTRDLQKEAGYVFKSLENCPIPIVISDDTKEVLVGYNSDNHLYDNILKEASKEPLKEFIKKYPEYKVKK
jgi:hypothetical protein